MNAEAPIRTLSDLIARIDAGVTAGCDQDRCDGVKNALVEATTSGLELLNDEFLAPAPEGYARRLLHKDPAGRYSIVVMVWDAGQGTPLHDHSGLWCVEAVYRGKIKVVSYSRAANRCSGTGIFDFALEETLVAGVGEAGALIPPFEYHTLECDGGQPAVTIHVYGGEMSTCTLFEPVEGGGYKSVDRALGYNA